jgi:hypothetical protein
MDAVIDSQRNGNPLFEKLLGTFAVLALILSAIGIYGLIAYSVGQRTQEIGIPMALGTKADDISRMVMREGLKVAVIGSVIGFALAIPAAEGLRRNVQRCGLRRARSLSGGARGYADRCRGSHLWADVSRGARGRVAGVAE